MIHYTIYRSDNDQLVLIGEQGQTVPATDILQAHPQTRVYAFEGKMGAGKTTFIRHIYRNVFIGTWCRRIRRMGMNCITSIAIGSSRFTRPLTSVRKNTSIPVTIVLSNGRTYSHPCFRKTPLLSTSNLLTSLPAH